MPLTLVTHGDLLNSDSKERLRKLLKKVIAEELDCSATEPDGSLEPGEINVRFQAYGPDDDQEYDVHILVIAKWYKTRADDVQERTARIRHRLCAAPVLPTGSSIGTFVTLPVAGWGVGYPGD